MAETDSANTEEILVYVEFEHSININEYRNVNVLGINEKTPIVQLDDTFFSGCYDVPLGTYMFFEDDQMPETTDPLFDKLPEKKLKYVCKTRKYVKMEHAYVSDKEGQSVKNESKEPEIEVPNIEFKDIMEAVEHFKSLTKQEPQNKST